MKPGTFYCYYKPSYVNGFPQFVGQDVDFNYLQAFEGVCRDEFTPISHAIFSDDYQIELEKSNGLYTEKFSKELFDSCFKRSFNVEYIFNTDMDEFRQKLKNGTDSKKPILFILWKEMFMSVYIQEFQKVLRDLDNLFEVYFCDDDQFAAQFFNTKMMPLELPHIYIIEPN